MARATAVDNGSGRAKVLRARGIGKSAGSNDTQDFRSPESDLVHEGETNLLVFAAVQPGEARFAESLKSKIAAVNEPDPQNDVALLKEIDRWNRSESKGGEGSTPDCFRASRICRTSLR